MTRPANITVGELWSRARRTQPGTAHQGLPQNVVTTLDVTGGMVTSIPRQGHQPNTFSLLRNGRTRDYWTGRRPGTAEILGVPFSISAVPGIGGNHLFILGLTGYFTEDGDHYIAAVRPTSVQYSRSLEVSVPHWVELAGLPNTINGAGRADFAQMFDWMFIANPENRIHYIDIPSEKLKEVENAPRARFITSFAERIVSGNIRAFLGGPVETRVHWSANGDPLDFEEDDSAGFVDLITNPSDTGDAITGLFGLERVMIVLRERSIWLATRQAVSISPFRFDAVTAKFGCDLPHTAVQIPGGVIWADYKTQGVYLYQVGGQPQRISGPIDDQLFEDFQLLTTLEAPYIPQGTYDPFNQEYHLGLPTSKDTKWLTKVWIFSFQRNAWGYDDGPEVTAISQSPALVDRVMIDELVGFIDGLLPQFVVIDDLSPGGFTQPDVYKAEPGGRLLRQSYDFNGDWDGDSFEWEAISQDLGAPFQRRTMREFQAKIEAPVPCFIVGETSNDRKNWRNTRTTTMTGVDTEQVAPINRAQSGKNIWWRLKSNRGQPRLTGWWARMLEHGTQHTER